MADYASANPPYFFSEMTLDNSANRKYVCLPHAHMRGRIAIVTARWARDAMDAAASGRFLPDETPAAYGEVVWAWRRDRGVYPVGRCRRGNGDKKRRSPGRARISRQTIARG